METIVEYWYRFKMMFLMTLEYVKQWLQRVMPPFGVACGIFLLFFSVGSSMTKMASKVARIPESNVGIKGEYTTATILSVDERTDGKYQTILQCASEPLLREPCITVFTWGAVGDTLLVHNKNHRQFVKACQNL